MNNRFELEKGSRKYICPNCGKMSFVYYRINGNGAIIHESVGRCDRIEKCGYHKKPREWFNEHPTIRPDYKSVKPIPEVTTNPISYIPLKYIDERANTRNSNFVYFLFNLFDWETIKKTIDPYFIGCTEDMAVVFPQIDEQGKCRTAKVQKYDRETGKRQGVYLYHGDKKIKPNLPNPYNLQMCLFGLHLIRSKNNIGKTVCICESEKSAIIAAGCMPEHIWMAAGALDWLNVEKLKPLRGWNIVLFPDTSTTGLAFKKWTKIADEATKAGLLVMVSTMLEDNCTDEEKANGYDLGDYLIDRILNKKQAIEPETPEEEPQAEQYSVSDDLKNMIRLNPAVQMLINNFDAVEVSTTES
ncbi:hypothetical protein JGH11_14985 [Dysgonomonas sp. Marseille-P4677]|uniref:DUF6371 domain-containing protein n=1 Tax=Dysgonomonas sp. Marseille-P4677 TaxID=2364790 RepID=UPI001911E98E|nr:DUF6371 domain-containing protein [Dysgonomonas sp. Marseille-P4677]MBK5722179.1 hypothetical protein [Dysgonomonas sp. Marseille-P4677]